jgi:hypothetical protein
MLVSGEERPSNTDTAPGQLGNAKLLKKMDIQSTFGQYTVMTGNV